MQSCEPTTTQGRQALPWPPTPHLHPIPGEGAGPATNRHSHVAARIQVAALDANPGAARKRSSRRAHPVEGWRLWEERVCLSGREDLPFRPEAYLHLQPGPRPCVHTGSHTQPTGRAQSVQEGPGVGPGDKEGRGDQNRGVAG